MRLFAFLPHIYPLLVIFSVKKGLTY
jgi:hypothetical protein